MQICSQCFDNIGDVDAKFRVPKFFISKILSGTTKLWMSASLSVMSRIPRNVFGL